MSYLHKASVVAPRSKLDRPSFLQAIFDAFREALHASNEVCRAPWLLPR